MWKFTPDKRDRPRVQVPRTALEHILSATALAGALFACAYLMAEYPGLPEKVPMHAGMSGRPDAWAGKVSLIPLALVSVFFFIILELLKRVHHQYNYPRPITPANAGRLYQLGRELMGWVQAEIVWLFAYLLYAFIQIAQGAMPGLGQYFFLVVIGPLLLTTVVYYFRMRRAC
jgi:uncharacterized membrane protein